MMIDFMTRHQRIRSWGCILGGIALYALALDLFLVGNNIAAGGVSGVAIVLNSFLPMDVGVMIFLMNLPILAVALVINGWRYTLGAIIGATLYSLAVQAGVGLPSLTDNPLVAAVFGGAIYGAGMALLSIGRGSTGGTDLACRLLVRRFPAMSLGKMSMVVDGSVVIFAMAAFRDIEVGLYAIITLFVCSLVADRIVLGFDRGCLCLVVTAKDPAALAAPLMGRLHRAVTKLSGVGMYSSTQRSVLLVAVKPAEAPAVKAILSQEDPEAFVLVLPANEILGGNFRTLSGQLGRSANPN